MTGDTMALWWNQWGKKPAIVVHNPTKNDKNGGSQKNGNGGAN
jgi:hypothetical protein